VKIFGKQFYEDHLGGSFLLGYLAGSLARIFRRQFYEDLLEALV